MTLIGEIVVNTSEGVNPPGDDALNGAAERLIRVVDKVFDRRLPESAKGQPDDSAPEPGERFTTWWQALLRREASRQRQADWRATSYPICGTGKRHRYTAVDGRVPDTRACRELNELTEDLTRLIKQALGAGGSRIEIQRLLAVALAILGPCDVARHCARRLNDPELVARLRAAEIETQVSTRLCWGLSTPEIAALLGVTKRTAARHVSGGRALLQTRTHDHVTLCT